MIRKAYLALRHRIMVRGGFDPSVPVWRSIDGRDFAARGSQLEATPLALPNLAGHLHFALRAFIEVRGLGPRCLLVSESRKVARALAVEYPETTFETADLYSELQVAQHGEDGKPDFTWDVTTPPPSGAVGFTGVVAHALLEHVIDPVAAIRNMLGTLEVGGHLFVMTHSPSFHVHRYPRDYVRFNEDFWTDLPAHLGRSGGPACALCDLYWHDGVFAVSFRRH